jgi:hypothetical protein
MSEFYENHTFYVVETEVEWDEGRGIAYFPDPNWSGSFTRFLTEAKRFTELGAKRKVNREKLLCPSGDFRVRKVEAVYTMEDLPPEEVIDTEPTEKKAEKEMIESRRAPDNFDKLKKRFGGDY